MEDGWYHDRGESYSCIQRDLQTGNSVESVRRSVVKCKGELFPTIFIKKKKKKEEGKDRRIFSDVKFPKFLNSAGYKY